MKILIIGIGSEIAYFTALKFAKDKNQLYCTSRNFNTAEQTTNDLKVRSGNKNIVPLELIPTELDRHKDFFDKFIKSYGLPDILYVAYGSLINNDLIKKDFYEVKKQIDINFTSVISIVNYFAYKFVDRNSGTIAVIGSVAGDRARGSNYVYGTAKGALSLFLQGLRSDLSDTKVKVLTIKPGFVATKMTADLKKNFLFANPKLVGDKIYHNILSGKEVQYIPGFWYLIMCIVKLIPEKIFKKLKF
ncbi:MAG TPA: SDR family NAD(P)-dependent oxidoreductase [Candidatus Kapabacteria bacterium]|nr:SDR family NAD(P)-dependent oxidoreductase [Candidatus Kapabacteria bacterium]